MLPKDEDMRKFIDQDSLENPSCRYGAVTFRECNGDISGKTACETIMKVFKRCPQDSPGAQEVWQKTIKDSLDGTPEATPPQPRPGLPPSVSLILPEDEIDRMWNSTESLEERLRKMRNHFNKMMTARMGAQRTPRYAAPHRPDSHTRGIKEAGQA